MNIRLLLAGLATLAALSTFAPPAPAQVDRDALATRVRDEYLFAWRAYQQHAWGHDELAPLSRAPRDWSPGQPLLVTPVEALDGLLLLGLREEADKDLALIVERLSFDRDMSVSVAETATRILGGLLSAYQMTGDRRLLSLATDLGNRLLPAFGSPTGMPYARVNLRTGRAEGMHTTAADIGATLLEFGTLSRLTGNEIYFSAARAAVLQVYSHRARNGLVGDEIDVGTGLWINPGSGAGAGIDAYYASLLKASRLFGDPELERMWKEHLASLCAYVAEADSSGLWLGQVDRGTGLHTLPLAGASTAQFAGLLAVWGDLDRAQRLQASSMRLWRRFDALPELVDYRTMQVVDSAYVLGPGITESIYSLNRVTRDPAYLEAGRTIFETLVRRCRTDAGYAELSSVTTGVRRDRMPGWFLAATLKYLFLLNAPDETLDFDHVVFTAGGHPLTRTW